MIDALFWYTGLIVWVLISLACASMIAVEAHDRSVMRRGRNIAQLLGGEKFAMTVINGAE